MSGGASRTPDPVGRGGAPSDGDLRGFGQTDKPSGVKQYAVEHLVDDVAALIDASGAAETLLLGHDWGVMLASQVAFHQVRPLERLAGRLGQLTELLPRALRERAPLFKAVEPFEVWCPRRALERNAEAARALGLTREGLYD